MTEGGVAIQSMQLRAEAPGVIASKAIAITPDVLDKWQTLTCEFTLADGDMLWFLRAMVPGYGHQFYVDNFRLAKLMTTAGVYLDADKTVMTSAGAFEYAAGDTVTLPSYADVLPYAPEDTIPLGYEIGGVMYEFGTKYTFRSTDPTYRPILSFHKSKSAQATASGRCE